MVTLCKRGLRFYQDKPHARQLVIGGRIPPQIKRADRDNDRRMSVVIREHFAAHFEMPKIPNELDVFFVVEIVDLFYCLSMLRYNEVTKSMMDEAARAAAAYLRIYLPEVMPRLRPT